MTVIEGIGDEVTHFFVLLFIIVLGLIAWRSTNIADRHLIRTTVLILERRSNRSSSRSPSASAQNEASVDTGQNNSSTTAVDDPPRIEELPDGAESSIGNIRVTPKSESDGLVDEATTSSSPLPLMQDPEPPSEAGNVRLRRIEFFKGMQSAVNDSSVVENNLGNSESNTEPSIVHINTNVSESEGTTDETDGMIRIRLKYLNDDQKLVQGKLQEQLGDFKKRHFSVELSAHKLVRLIFNGQVLQRDNSTLQDYGLFDNCVVHCLIHQQRSTQETQTAHESSGNSTGGAAREWDLGNILFALLSLALGVCWFCRYQYPQLFTATTTVSLISLTGFLTVYLIGMYMPDQDGIRE